MVAWEQRKFEEFTKISQGLQIAISERLINEGVNRLFYITNEFLNPNSSIRYYIEDAPKSVIANLEDILMTRTGNTGKVVTNVHGAFHNNFFKIAYDNLKTNKLFLYTLLNSDYVQNEIRIGAGSSTIPDLKHPNFYRIKVKIPKLEEQTKIGNFFKQLEETITLHERELELLKFIKIGFLQQLFTDNQQKFPNIRFANFHDEWEQCKLGEIVIFFSGLTYSPENVKDKGTLVLRSSNIKNNNIVSADDVFVDDTVVNCEQVQIGDVIVVVRNGSKALIGKHAIIDTKMNNTVIGAFMTGIRSKSPYFINAILSTRQFNKEVEKNLGATINQITTSSFKRMEFIISKDPEEQTKIGDFFKEIDKTISLQEDKLKKLKDTKKSFLQKMFI